MQNPKRGLKRCQNIEEWMEEDGGIIEDNTGVNMIKTPYRHV